MRNAAAAVLAVLLASLPAAAGPKHLTRISSAGSSATNGTALPGGIEVLLQCSKDTRFSVCETSVCTTSATTGVFLPANAGVVIPLKATEQWIAVLGAATDDCDVFRNDPPLLPRR
jgi:hypothetical protein